MDQYGALIVLPNLMASAFLTWVTYKVYTGNRTQHRLAMSICFAFVAINSLVLLGEKLFSDLDVVLFLVLLEYICESIIILTLMVFVLQYAGLGRAVNPRNVLLLALPAALSILFNVTNPWHGLFYTSVDLVQSHGFHTFTAVYGPLFLFWIGYFMLSLTATTLLVAKVLLDAPKDRRQAMWTLMVAMGIMMITGVLNALSDRSDPLVDILSIGMTLTALTLFIGERRAAFVDMSVIRVKEAMAGMEDAVLVLNPSLRAAYANEHGQRILDQNIDLLREKGAAVGLKFPVGSLKLEMALKLDGTFRHYSVSSSDIRRGEEVIGAVLVFHDISVRKSMEEDLHQANHRLNTMNQVILHDLRNSLTATWGYMELLEATELTPRQSELVNKMAEGARKTDGYLGLAKDMQAIGSSRPIWHDLQGIMELVREQVDLSHLQLISTVKGFRVLGDPMLPNVFHSLADNSVRHGGHATRIQVRAESSDEGLNIIWEDDGEGVPAGLKERIFGKGFGRNTGLGLFLAREIVSLSGGTIGEEGEPNKGARFVVRFPIGSFEISS